MLLFISAFFFSLSYFYTVFSKRFSTSFAAKSRIMANHFAKQRVSDLVAITHDDNCVKIACSKAFSSSDILDVSVL